MHPARKRRAFALAGVIALLAILHCTLPTRGHGWHAVHLILEKLQYVPILLAAAWLSPRGVALATGALLLAFGLHVRFDWSHEPAAQHAQMAEMLNLVLVAIAASAIVAAFRRSAERLRRARREALEALGRTIELREHETAGHSARVRDYALRLAQEAGLEAAERESLEIGAILHDIGKIGLPDEVLFRQGPLSDGDRVLVRQHTEEGAAFIGAVPTFRPAQDIVGAYLERWDGWGYPRGLSGEGIPRIARVFSVAHMYDALTAPRPGRAALSHAEAVAKLGAAAGTQFDPKIVAAFRCIPAAELQAIARRTGVELVERAPALSV